MSRSFYPRSLNANFKNPAEVLGLSRSATSNSVIFGKPDDTEENYTGLTSLDPPLDVNNEVKMGSILLTDDDAGYAFLQAPTDTRSVLQFNGNTASYTVDPKLNQINLNANVSISHNGTDLIFNATGNVYRGSVSNSNRVIDKDYVNTLTSVYVKKACISSITSEIVDEYSNSMFYYTTADDTKFNFIYYDNDEIKFNAVGTYNSSTVNNINNSTITFEIKTDLIYFTKGINANDYNPFVSGDRIFINLFKGEVNTSRMSQMNGIYIYTPYNPIGDTSPYLTRADDFNSSETITVGSYVFSKYTLNFNNVENHSYILSKITDPFSLATNEYTFIPFNITKQEIPILGERVLLRGEAGKFEATDIKVSDGTVTLSGQYNVGASSLTEYMLNTTYLRNKEGDGLMAIGKGVNNAIAFGNTEDIGENSVALGVIISSVGDNCITIGNLSKCNGNNSICISSGNSTEEENFGSWANSADSIAIGSMAVANSSMSIAIGGNSTTQFSTSATEVNSISIGMASSADGINAVSIGHSSVAEGINSVSINGTVSTDNTFAVLNNLAINTPNVSVIPASMLVFDDRTTLVNSFKDNTSRAVCLSVPLITGSTSIKSNYIILPNSNGISLLSINTVSLINVNPNGSGTDNTDFYLYATNTFDPEGDPVFNNTGVPVVDSLLHAPNTIFNYRDSIKFIDLNVAYNSFRIDTAVGAASTGSFRVIIEGILLETNVQI